MKLRHRPVCNHTTLLSLHGFFSEKVTKPHDVLVTFPGVASLVVDADDNQGVRFAHGTPLALRPCQYSIAPVGQPHLVGLSAYRHAVPAKVIEIILY